MSNAKLPLEKKKKVLYQETNLDIQSGSAAH